jgi:Cys-rich repeat protein
MNKPLAIACLLIALGGATPAGAYEITNCPPWPTSDLRAAANFLRDNMSTLVDQYTFLTERQRQEIVRKWVGLNIHCSDKEGMCDKFRGHAHGGPGNRVNICYYSYTSSDDLCDLVSTIMHEQGHAHGFRMVPGHNDPTNYHYENDPIYRMGSIAEDFCESAAAAGNFANASLKGGGNRNIGDDCKEDLQCRSSRCSGGECVCNEDSDCPTGQECFKPAAAKNFCSSTSRALGESCGRDDQCRSNQCEDEVCVCRHDSDCPSGQVCKTPVTGKNSCEASEDVGAKALGAECDRDSDCLSNKCESDECVCNSDSDCPDGQECYRPVTETNDCRPVGLTLGKPCQRDSQCRSNKCEKDECVCRTNDDCPAGQVCKTPITGKNHCED